MKNTKLAKAIKTEITDTLRNKVTRISFTPGATVPDDVEFGIWETVKRNVMPTFRIRTEKDFVDAVYSTMKEKLQTFEVSEKYVVDIKITPQNKDYVFNLELILTYFKTYVNRKVTMAK